MIFLVTITGTKLDKDGTVRLINYVKLFNASSEEEE